MCRTDRTHLWTVLLYYLSYIFFYFLSLSNITSVLSVLLYLNASIYNSFTGTDQAFTSVPYLFQPQPLKDFGGVVFLKVNFQKWKIRCIRSFNRALKIHHANFRRNHRGQSIVIVKETSARIGGRSDGSTSSGILISPTSARGSPLIYRVPFPVSLFGPIIWTPSHSAYLSVQSGSTVQTRPSG